jgi:hypothetical protein
MVEVETTNRCTCTMQVKEQRVQAMDAYLDAGMSAAAATHRGECSILTVCSPWLHPRPHQIAVHTRARGRRERICLPGCGNSTTLAGHMHAAMTTLDSSPGGNKAHPGHASSVKKGLDFQWRIDNMVTLVSEAMCEKPQALDLTLPRYASHTVTCVQCKPACTTCRQSSCGRALLLAMLAGQQSHSL